jgi:hypothetical protein
MSEFTIHVVTPEEHKQWCKQQIEEKGLYNAVKEQLDEWMDICHHLDYRAFSESTEHAMNILDFIETFGEIHGVYNPENQNNTDNPHPDTEKIQNMLDLFYANKHMYDKLQARNHKCELAE